MIIPATVAALTSTISSMPLQVLARTDAITGVEIEQGVMFVFMDENYDSITGISVDIYDVSGLQQNANGNYDISNLTSVKSVVTQEEETSLGLDTGKYVAKITPPDGYVLSNYNKGEKNGANELYFEVDEERFTNIRVGFLPTDAAKDDILQVTVFDENNNTVAGVVVDVVYEAFNGDLQRVGEFTSNDSGVIAFAALDDSMPAGGHYYCKIKTLPSGYAIDGDEFVTVQAISGRNNGDLYLVSAETKHKYTLIFNDSITTIGIADLDIIICDADGNETEYSTDASGQVIANLSSGKYTIAAKNTNLNFDITEIEVIGQGRCIITVTDATPKGDVTFNVMDSNANDISDIYFDIYDSNNNLLYPNRSVTDGIGKIYDLVYGDYKAVFVDLPAKYISDNGTKTVEFTVSSTSKTVPVVLALNDALYGNCSIELEITDADTYAKLMGETVKILNENNQVIQTVTMDSEGFAIFNNLPEGTYHFELSENSKYYIVEGQTVTVDNANNIAWQEVQAKKLTTTLVIGTQCPESALVKNLTVSLYKNGSIYGTYQLKNGTLNVPDLTVGDYEIVVKNVPSNYKLTSDNKFSITTSDRVINQTLVFEAATAALTVSIVDTNHNNAPVPNAEIAITDGTGKQVANMTTDGMGVAGFVLPLGNYTISTVLPHGYAAIADRTVNLNIADATLDVTLETSYKTATLHVLVTDEQNLAVNNATIEVVNEKGVVVSTKTMTNGDYSLLINDLPLGKYTIRTTSYDDTLYLKPSDMVVELLEEKVYDVYYKLENVPPAVTTGDVNITLKNEQGETVSLTSDLLIAIYNSNGDMILCDYANTDGKISFAELDEGSYTASVFYADAPWFATEKSNVKFQIAAGETTEVDMTLYKGIGSAVFNVTDNSTGKAVAGVTLELFKDGVSVGTYTTDTNGQIKINELDTGTYTYTIVDVPDGYESVSGNTFDVEVDETTTIDITLVAQTGQAIINIVDQKGRLLYETVAITLTAKDGTVYNYTSNNGIINTGWIKTGTYTITVNNEIDGYSLTSAGNVEVIADETATHNIVFAQDSGNANVKVEIQNLTGNKALANTKIELRTDTNSLVGVYTTDENGYVELPNLTIGKYSVTIANAGLPAGYTALSGASFEITKNCNEEVVLYVLRDTGNVNILVSTGSGQALENIDVSLYDEDGKLFTTVRTNSNGYANFTQIPTGNYTAKTNIDESQNDVSGDFEYSVMKNDTKNGTIFINRHTGWLFVKCNLEVAGIAFDVYQGDVLVASGVTDDMGEALVNNLPTGRYTIKYTNVPSKYEDLREEAFSISQNEETVMHITLTEKSSVMKVKYVYDLTGYPTAGVKFNVTTLAGEVVDTFTTDENGLVEMFLPEGNYFLKTVDVPVGYAIPADQAFEVVDGEDGEITIRLAEVTSYGEFALLVMDSADSAAIADATVKLYTTNGSLYKTLMTDARGQIYDSEIASGSYYAVISKDGYAEKILENVEVAEGNMFFETVLLDKATTDIGDLVVTVYDNKTGEVLSGATVCLRAENGDIIKALTADANGVVTFEDIAYGNYKISAEADGYVESARISAIISAETQSASIHLDACTTGSLIVNVHNDSDEVLGDVVIVLDNGENHYEITTNAQGVAELPVIEAGEYNVTVELDGYEKYTSKLTIAANIDNSAEIELIEFKLGNIEFTVVDDNDAPLNNVKITLSDGTILHTDENGLVSVEKKDIGSYSAAFELDGYESKNVSFNVEKDTTTKVIVGLNKIVTTGNLEFNVSDEDGNALSNVTINIDGKDYKTDDKGYVLIENLEAGNYDVAISKDGYNSLDRNIAVNAKATTTVNVTMTKAVTTGTVNVVVTDVSGNALADATVVLSDGENEKTVKTDASGMITFDEVETGSYTVTVSKDGYKNSTATVEVDAGKTYTINAKLEEVAKTGNLQVVVKDEDGNLIEGANVLVNGQSVLSDANGVASFDNLDEGKYDVEITKDGYDKFTASVEVVAGATKQANAILIKAVTTGKLVVTVTDNDGNVITDADVVIDGVTYKTDTAGLVTLHEMEAGTYSVAVSKDGYISETHTVTIKAKEEVRLGVILDEVDTTGDLVVTVVDTDGNVLTDAVVEINGKTVTTNAEGIANIDDLAEGSYSIKISKDGYEAKSGTIEITAGVINRTTVTLEKEINRGNVHVVVKDVDGVLLQGATIKIYDGDNVLIGTYTTDANGELTVSDLDVAKYSLHVEYVIDENHGLGAVQSFEIEKDKTTEVMVQFAESAVPETTGDAYITVKDVDNAVLENVTVKLNNGTLLSGTTTADGTVIFEDLAPGEYAITAELNGYHAYAGAITIVAGEIAEATIVLNPITTGSLAVTVTDTDGNVLPNATVEVDGKTYTSDDKGLVKIDTIEAGQYSVKVSLNGYVAKSVDVTVSAMTENTCAVSLEKEVYTGTGKIVVKDEDGNVLENATVQLGNAVLKTDANGIAVFEELEAGTYDVTVSKLGFKAQTAQITIVAKETTTLDFSLVESDGSVRFTVKDEAGNVLSNAIVVIDGKTYCTDTDGKVTAAGLLPKTYSWTISKDGYYESTGVVQVNADLVSEVVVVMREVITTGILSVTVIDEDGKALAGATVEVAGKNAITDENGKVTFTNLEAGNYEVTATKDGYVARSTQSTIEAEKTTETTIALEKEITTGNLLVTVVDKDGNPIANATVRVSTGETYTTNSEGIIELVGLDAGEHTIRVLGVGYYAQTKTVIITAKETAMLTVILEKIPETGTVEFNVYNELNVTIPNAKVVINGKEYITDENGHIPSIELPVGEYEAIISADSYRTVTQTVYVTPGENTAIRIVLDNQKGNLLFNVVNFAGSGLEGAEVYLRDKNRDYTYYTDANGNLEIQDLLIGTYEYVVTLDGYLTIVGEFEIHDTQDTIVIVKMMQRQTTAPVEFIVTDKQGNVLPNTEIEVEGLKGTTDAEGRVTLNVPLEYNLNEWIDKEYSYKAKKDGYHDVTGTFHIGPNAITRVPVTMEKEPDYSKLSFQVKDAGGFLVKDVTITISNGTDIVRLTTDENGYAQLLDLLYGDYTIVVSKEGYKSITLSEKLDTEDGKHFALTLETDVPPIEVGTVIVKVVDQNGNPVANSEVVLMSKTGTYKETVFTNANGEITITADADDYYVSAYKNGYVADSKVISVALNEVTEVTLTLEQITVEEKAYVEVNVKNQKGDSIVNSKVVITDVNGNVVYEGTLTNTSHLYLEDLVDGTYNVTVTKAGHKTATTAFNAVTGETTIVNIVLEEIVEEVKAGAFDILVTNENGTPLGMVIVTILNEDGTMFGSFSTMSDGKIYISAVPEGKYSMYASYAGVDSNSAYAEVVGDQVTTVKIIIDASKPGKPDKPGGGDNVQTGDDSNVFLYGILAIVSAIGAFFTRKNKKKKED